METSRVITNSKASFKLSNGCQGESYGGIMERLRNTLEYSSASAGVRWISLKIFIVRVRGGQVAIGGVGYIYTITYILEDFEVSTRLWRQVSLENVFMQGLKVSRGY
tara:strand:+ start:1074 stop:1394 length:321 start_codon:yes stop_codon:yes gene_type:complete